MTSFIHTKLLIFDDFIIITILMRYKLRKHQLNLAVTNIVLMIMCVLQRLCLCNVQELDKCVVQNFIF